MSAPATPLPEMVAAYSRYELCPPTDDEFRRVAAWMMYLASRMVHTTRQTDALRRFADSGRIAALYPEAPFAAVACWVAGIDARSEVQAYCALLVRRADALRQELLAAQAAERPVPERPAKGVTVEQARAATHVNAGGVWKQIIRVNPKSVVILWGGTDRERIPLDKLTTDDLRTQDGAAA